MLFFGKIIDLSFKPSNQKNWLDFMEKNNKKNVVVDIKLEKGVRTINQNDALHLWFEMLAKSLNEAGYFVQLVLKEKVDLEWDKEKVKELLWRPAQKAITKKKSTTELDKVSEIDLIYEHLNRHLGEKFGIHIPFPTKEKEFQVDVAYPENNLGESKF